jgi:hypothetical protein
MENTEYFLYCHFFTDNTKGVIKTIKVPLKSLDIHVIELKSIIAKYLELKKQPDTPLFNIVSLNKTLLSKNMTDTVKISNFFNNKDDIYCGVQLNIQPIKVTQVKSNEEDILKFKTLSSYSFYVANKQIVKVLVPLKGVDNLPKENIKFSFTETSFDVKVYNLNGLNYAFGVPRLDAKIIPEKSDVQAKDGNIIIRLRKAKEDDHWSYLHKQKYAGED